MDFDKDYITNEEYMKIFMQSYYEYCFNAGDATALLEYYSSERFVTEGCRINAHGKSFQINNQYVSLVGKKVKVEAVRYMDVPALKNSIVHVVGSFPMDGGMRGFSESLLFNWSFQDVFDDNAEITHDIFQVHPQNFTSSPRRSGEHDTEQVEHVNQVQEASEMLARTALSNSSNGVSMEHASGNNVNLASETDSRFVTEYDSTAVTQQVWKNGPTDPRTPTKMPPKRFSPFEPVKPDYSDIPLSALKHSNSLQHFDPFLQKTEYTDPRAPTKTPPKHFSPFEAVKPDYTDTILSPPKLNFKEPQRTYGKSWEAHLRRSPIKSPERTLPPPQPVKPPPEKKATPYVQLAFDPKKLKRSQKSHNVKKASVKDTSDDGW